MMPNIVKVVAIAVVLGYLGHLSLLAIRNLEVSDYGTYYVASELIFNGENPYGNLAPYPPFYYPPSSFPLFFPFSFLTFAEGKIFFTLISLLSYAGIVVLLTRIIKRQTIAWGIFISALFLFTYPFYFTLVDGQVNLIILLLVLLTYRNMITNHAIRSGIFLGLAGSLKITPFGFLLPLLLLKKYKIAFMSILIVFGLSILSEVIISSGGSINKFYWLHIADDISKQGGVKYTDQSVQGFLYRSIDVKNIFQQIFIPKISEEVFTFRQFVSVINYTIIGFLVLALNWWAMKRKLLTSFTFWSLLLLIFTLGSGLAWFHHYLFVLVSLVVLAHDYIYKIKLKLNLLHWGLLSLCYFMIAFNFHEQFNIRGLLPEWYQFSLLYAGIILGILCFNKLKKELP